MKTTQIAGVLGVCILAGSVTLSGQAASFSSTPVANLTEKWASNDAGWRFEIKGQGATNTTVWESGALAANYSARTLWTTTDMNAILATGSASGGRFVGNYNEKAIASFMFDVKSESFSGTLDFYFIGASGNFWHHSVPVPTGSGWTTVTIPTAYDSKWTPLLNVDGPAAAAMVSDLSGVSEVGINIYRQGSQSQNVVFDNFKLVGPWGQIITSGPQAGLSASWLSEFPLPVGKDGANDDADGDGVSNLAEFTAGTSATDASSLLAINIRRNSEGKTVLGWTPKPFRTYTIKQASDLTSDQNFISKVAGVQSLDTNNEIVVDETGDGPYFYKVEVEQQVTP